jgi:hypothetical protein
MFPGSRITYFCPDSQPNGSLAKELDMKMGIDKILYVQPPHYRRPVPFTVQERFRTMKDSHYRQVTITEWNEASDTPSELYKLMCQYFVYAYYDTNADFFTEAIVLNVPQLQAYIMQSGKQFLQRNDKQQPFVCLDIDTLLKQDGVVFYHERNDDPQWYDESDPNAANE